MFARPDRNWRSTQGLDVVATTQSALNAPLSARRSWIVLSILLAVVALCGCSNPNPGMWEKTVSVTSLGKAAKGGEVSRTCYRSKQTASERIHKMFGFQPKHDKGYLIVAAGLIHGERKRPAAWGLPASTEKYSGSYDSRHIHVEVDMSLYGGIRQTVDLKLVGDCPSGPQTNTL